MKITVEAEPKEIAALVNSLQGQQKSMDYLAGIFQACSNGERNFLPNDATRYHCNINYTTF